MINYHKTLNFFCLSLMFSLILFKFSTLTIKNSYSTGIFLKNYYLIKTPFITLYCFFYINYLSLIFVILTTFILILCTIWSCTSFIRHVSLGADTCIGLWGANRTAIGYGTSPISIFKRVNRSLTNVALRGTVRIKRLARKRAGY